MKKIQFLKVGDYMKTITRTKYLDRIIELNGTPDIKIITGIRRSGKSKLMQAYIEYLKSNFENINIIFIDFMDLAYEEIMEYHADCLQMCDCPVKGLLLWQMKHPSCTKHTVLEHCHIVEQIEGLEHHSHL